jgi:hypothetical protein
MDTESQYELTDDQITAFIGDPATIPDHDTALLVLDCLEAEIVNIQAQIDQAMAESTMRPLSEDRQAWLKRASYACAMRRNERHKVFMRDKEIRGTKIQQGSRKSPAEVEERRLKQLRLMEEAAARREKAAAKRASDLVRVEELRLSQMEVAQRKRELAAAGCICPPTSEQTCQNGLCPRKALPR